MLLRWHLEKGSQGPVDLGLEPTEAERTECYRIRTSLLDMSDTSLSKMASNPMHSPILPDKHWYALFLPSERTSTHYYNRTFTQALVSFFALLYLYVSLNAQIRNITLLHSSSTSNNNYPQYKAPPPDYAPIHGLSSLLS